MTATFGHMQDVAIGVPDGEISVWRRPPESGGETAVLVHGLSGNSRWWTSVVKHLPNDMGVIALDVRGRGESVGAPEPFGLATIADDIARCLDHFEIEQAIVAGYSMGGWVVALFGVEYPGRVERLLLVDGGLPLPRDPDGATEEMIDALVGPSLRRLEIGFESEEAYYDYWKGHPAFAKHWDESMKPALGHELVRRGDHFEVRANPDAIRVGARQMIADEEANTAAGRLTVPSHLIVVERGTMDQQGGMTPLDVAEEATRANRRLTMEFLPGINHYTLILGSGAPSLASAIVGSG